MKTNRCQTFTAFSLVVITLLATKAQCQIIDRFAGNGQPGFSGDNGPAITAKLSYPFHLSSDLQGNIYIADMNNAAIRKVNSSGIITTIAGGRPAGYTGDGGPATLASLNYPLATAIDATGNVFVVDQGNFVVRKINTSGIISTVAGNGTKGYNGDGGIATSAQLSFPIDVAVDRSGNLYIADQDRNVVRRVDQNGVIATFAGNGAPGYSGDGGMAISAKLNRPAGVTVDDIGNVYIADQGNSVIRKVNPSGIIVTFAGNGTQGFSGDGGSATAAQFASNSPMDVEVDKNGNVYASDYQNHTIRQINTNGIINTVAGIPGIQGSSGDGGLATSAKLWFPVGLTVDACNNLYFSEPFNAVLRKVTFTPSLLFTTQPTDAEICANNSASFEVQAGNADDYQWQISSGSDWIPLVNDAVYMGVNTTQLQIVNTTMDLDGKQYRCVAKNSCSTVQSSAATLHILNSSSPLLSISASSTDICEGTIVTFTTNATNVSNAIHYQWKKNSSNVGADDPVYKDVDLIDGDRIECNVVTNDICGLNKTATSNTIIVKVTQPLTPSISISSSATTICSGSTMSFSAAVSNGGLSPVYQWKKNGIDVGSNSTVYAGNNFIDGDKVQCMVTSNNVCQLINTAQSNTVILTITEPVTPDISITASSLSVCAGSPVHFIAIAKNSGLSPSYHWERNGTTVGANSEIFDDLNPIDGETITCKVITNNGCFTQTSAISAESRITVFPAPIVSLDHTPTLCEGTTRQLQAGNFSTYLWNDGSTQKELTVYGTGFYYVTVTDNHGCMTSDTTRITTILQNPSNFLPGDIVICSNTILQIRPIKDLYKYLWNDGSHSSDITVVQPGIYSLEASDQNGCRGIDQIVVEWKNCLKGFYIPNVFTPNGDGKNDVFKPSLNGIVTNFYFAIYNRWGQLVFQTRDLDQGWNGSFNGVRQQANVFTWICLFQLEGQPAKKEKGTVLLLR